MPIKKDETGKRWVELQLLVSATPEQVWHALATGPGNTSWFTKTEIDGRVGGALKFDFGPEGSSAGEVTEWEPPARFGYVERDWKEDAPPVATEITITSRSGDRCLVRMVHSLFSSSESWDDQMEGFEAGWPAFFEVLRVYLGHFAGQTSASFSAMITAPGDALASFGKLCDALGISGVNVGERRDVTSGPEPWSGVVEHAHQDQKQRYYVLRLEQPSPGIALVGTHDRDGSTTVSVCRYFYGDDAEARVAGPEASWRSWLAQSFPPAPGA
jgi:uncharacterized protein YndB with AHSA1/START domain